jgi:hypothetical protein
MANNVPTKKEVLNSLAEAFPTATIFKIFYYGAGDSFGDFDQLEVNDADGKSMPEYEAKSQEFQNITGDYMFHIFNVSGQPDFNNDGSEGYITFDLLNKVVILDNYYMEDTTPEYDGDENDPDYDIKRDEYWDDVERESEATPTGEEIF